MVGSPRILLIRTSALGDIVHCLPVLTALRRHFPDAHLGWVVEEAFAPLLEGHPDLDEIVPVATRTWRRRMLAPATLRRVVGFAGAVHSFGADVALDLMGNHKAGAIAALSFADRRIGALMTHRCEASSALWTSVGVAPRGVHAVDRALSLLDALGVPPAPADFGAHKLLGGPEATVETDEPFVLIHPGAGWGNKCYPARWWGEVARRVGESTGMVSRVAAGPGEEPLAREVRLAADGWARSCNAGTLPALARTLRGARLALGGDTGPIHLAHALGTPVLCLMGPTDPAASGPYGAPEATLTVALPCSYCNRRYADAKACLLEIPPTRVAQATVAALA